MWGARADQIYDWRLLRFTAPDLLIDDLGLRPLQHDEPLDRYEVIRQRHERGALIIYLEPRDRRMGQLFKDELLASAAVDRLLHHSHVLVMEGETAATRGARHRAQEPTTHEPQPIHWPVALTPYKSEIRSAVGCWPSRHSRRHVLFARLDPRDARALHQTR